MNKLLVFTVFLFLFTHAQAENKFLEYYFQHFNTVGKIKSYINKSSLDIKEKSKLLNPLSNISNLEVLPKVTIFDQKNIEIDVSEKKYIIKFNDNVHSEIIVNGRIVKMIDNFELNYQSLKDLTKADTGTVPEWESWAYLTSVIMEWKMCEYKLCTTSFFYPAFLAWKTIEVIFPEEEINYTAVNNLIIKCPQNNAGKLRYEVKRLDQKKTYQITMSYGTPYNIIETIEKDKNNKLITNYLINPDWSIPNKEEEKSHLNLKKLSSSFKEIVESCKSDSKEIESL